MIFAFRRCFSSRLFFISYIRKKSFILIRIIKTESNFINAVYSRFFDLFIVSLCACWITGSACDVCSMRITAWHLTELSRAIARYEYALLRSPWVYSCCPRSCRETISSVADFMSAMADFAR